MTIEERMDRIERQNRRLKGGLVLVLLAVAVGGLLWFARKDQVPDVVKAKAFYVVTDDGTVLVKIEDALGIGLVGTVTTLNGKGEELVQLGATIDGDGTVTTLNGKGQDLVNLGVTTGGEGTVTTLNGKGQRLVGLGVSTEGAGMVTTLNSQGQELVTLGVSVHGGGVVTTSNGMGQKLVQLTATTDDEALIVVHDPNGKKPSTVIQPGE